MTSTTPRKQKRGRKMRGRCITIFVDDETQEKVDALCEVFRANSSVIFRQAIIRLWHAEKEILQDSTLTKINGKKEKLMKPFAEET